jgi:hypothetical protein
MKTKFFIKLLKFLAQPGRLVFAKGSYDINKVVDSFSAEYVLLIQEKVRAEVTGFSTKFRNKPVLFVVFFPFFILFYLILLLRLFATNQIVLSMLNSGKIKELIIENQS